MYRAVSLFSNCGAGDVGYHQAGFQFEVMAELDPRRLEVCLLNHPSADGVPGDLRNTWTTVIAQYRAKTGSAPLSLLAACPPCQGMSSARSSKGRGSDPDAGIRDKRNLLVTVIADVALDLRPDIIVVENVPSFLTRLIRHPNTEEPTTAPRLLIDLLKADYHTFSIITDLCDYGVPQIRRRAFLTLVRKDVSGIDALIAAKRFPFPRPTHSGDYDDGSPVTITEALESFGLPSLDANTMPSSIKKRHGGLHTVPAWSGTKYRMIAAIQPNSSKSAWQNNDCKECGEINMNPSDAICQNCTKPLLRPIVIEPSGTFRLVKGFKSSYRRMNPDMPAATITTSSGSMGSDTTIHPSENRVLSTLECAYLQTFPKSFKWGRALKDWGHTNIRAMIGEAVPPRFTKRHGQVLIQILAGKSSRIAIPETDIRCVRAQKRLGIKTE